MKEMRRKNNFIKCRPDFFTKDSIVAMRRLPGGEAYVMLYLTLLTIAVENDGYLHYEGIENTHEEELALSLDENINKLRMGINLFRTLGLLEDCKNGDYYFPDAVYMKG